MKGLLWSVFGLALVLSAVGFYEGGLFQQDVWEPAGLRRLGWLAAGFTAWSLLLLRLRPALFRPLTAGLALAYTVVVVGPAAPAAVALVLFSACLLGSLLVDDDLLAVLPGLAAYAWLIGVAASTPVHYPLVYLVAFSLPVLAQPRRAAALGGRLLSWMRGRAGGGPADALLAFALVALWLVALKPEVSADGMAMHLAIPAHVAAYHQWHFDVTRVVWAVMPMSADWSFTAAYLLGGEYAARLLNFAVLCLIVALVFTAIRQWLSRPAALVLAAVFAASPIVQLATGSLMAENVWAAFVSAAVVALARYRESGSARWLCAAGVLAGAAIATKYGAIAFAIALAVMAGFEVSRRRAVKPVLLAVVCLVVSASPPYATAYRKTGNPVFPFLNAVFQSPYFDSTASFADTRFHNPVGIKTAYDVTFHTDRHLEARKGGFAFQYFVLLPLVVLLWRRDWPYLGHAALLLGAAYLLLTFPSQPNLRYAYPALPLLTIAIGAGLARLRDADLRLYRGAIAASVALFGLNIYFTAASGWYHRGFFLLGRAEVERYIDFAAPQRRLIEYLNSRHPGAPVLYVEGSEIAGLRARAFTLTWHTDSFAKRWYQARSTAEWAKLAKEAGIRTVIAPAGDYKLVGMKRFLADYAAEEYRCGNFFAGRLNPDASVPDRPLSAEPAPPGVHDDSSPAISYTGPWIHDRSFEATTNRSLTYCSRPGASFRVLFSGEEVTWVYTRTFNRGIASVMIDGKDRGVVDQFGPQTQWQSRATFSGLGAGVHELVIEVLPRRNPSSADYYIDVDGLIVR
jgi:hypothetical protein